MSEYLRFNCMKCPQCHLTPVVEAGEIPIELVCRRHGHRAVGDTLVKAVRHWNMYVCGISSLMSDGLRVANESRAQRAIFNALFDIDKNEREAC